MKVTTRKVLFIYSIDGEQVPQNGVVRTTKVLSLPLFFVVVFEYWIFCFVLCLSFCFPCICVSLSMLCSR